MQVMLDEKIELNQSYDNVEDIDNNLQSSLKSEDEPLDLATAMDVHIRRPHIYCTLILGLGNASDAVEVLAVGYVLKNYRDLDNLPLTMPQKQALTAAVFIGMLIGGILSGILSDIAGRKHCLLVCLAINSFGTMSSAFSPSTTWFIFFRVLAGIGVGGTVPSVFALATELFPRQQRGRLISAIASFWMVGTVSVAAVAWLILGTCSPCPNASLRWRWLMFFASIPAIFATIFTWLFLPQSPYYLMMLGQSNAAADVLHQLTGMSIEAAQTVCTVTGSKKNLSSTGKTYRDFVNMYTILFSTNIKHTTIVLMMLWCTLSYSSYGISTWITTIFFNMGVKNVYGFTLLYAFGSLPGNIISIWLADIIGRRKLLTCSMFIAMIIALLFSLRPANWILIICACIFNATVTSGWNALDCFSSESFPTNIRASGMGIVSAAGRIGAIIAQLVNASLENNISLLFCFTAVILIIGISSLYTLSNTVEKYDH